MIFHIQKVWSPICLFSNISSHVWLGFLVQPLQYLLMSYPSCLKGLNARKIGSRPGRLTSRALATVGSLWGMPFGWADGHSDRGVFVVRAIVGQGEALNSFKRFVNFVHSSQSINQSIVHLNRTCLSKTESLSDESLWINVLPNFQLWPLVTSTDLWPAQKQ